MSKLLRHQLLLGLIAGLVFFTNLGGYALFDEDEPKNAVCGREMFERGDWIVPTFNGGLRTDKPILIYWWMQLSFRCFGVSEFSARFGSAVLALGTVLLTYHLGRKLYSAETGLLAGIILATCLMFSAVGRAVTPDATLIFCLMLAFTSYVWAVASRRGGHFCGTDEQLHWLSQGGQQVAPARILTVDSQSHCLSQGGQAVAHLSWNANSWKELLPASRWTSVPMYAAMGLAILAKGPIGVLLPCTIIGLYLLVSMRLDELGSGRLSPPSGSWWRRAWTVTSQILDPRRVVTAGLAMRLLWGALIVLIVACPWYLLVGIQTNGAWLRGFLGDHNVGRFLEPKENHSGPIFYYAIVLMLGCFPWSVFLPMAVWRLRRRLITEQAWSDSDRFLACWVGVWFCFFSLASTKLPNYVLPMYPALALITARFLKDWQSSATQFDAWVFRNCCRVLGGVGALGAIALPIAISMLMPGEEWLLVIGLIPLTGATMAYIYCWWGQRQFAIRAIATSAVLLAVVIVAIAPTRLVLHQDSPKLAEAARRVTGMARPDIGVVEGFSPSLVYYARKPVKPLQPAKVGKYLQDHPDAVILTRADRMELLPEDAAQLTEVARVRRFLRKYDLVLLARPTTMAAVPGAAKN